MAVVMMMEWKGVTAEQYDAVRRETNFENDPPKGGMYHVAAVDDEGLKVVDVWNSPEEFQAFAEAKLMPVTQKLGITEQPNVKFYPAYNIFAGGYTAK